MYISCCCNSVRSTIHRIELEFVSFRLVCRLFVSLPDGLSTGQLEVSLDLVEFGLLIGDFSQGGQAGLGGWPDR